MKSVKEIAKWLKEEVEFLKENEDYCGGWLKLDDTYAAVVLWEEGWGEEERDDVIQSVSNPDWALCAGVKIFNPADTVDGWLYPSNAKTGDMLCESCGIEPEEDYDALAKWVVDCYDVVKDFVPEEDGTIVVEIEEDMEDEEIGVKSDSSSTPELRVKPNNKEDAKAPTQQRKNTTTNNKENAKESISESLDKIELKSYDDVENIKSRCLDCKWEILVPRKGEEYFNRYLKSGARLFVFEKDGEMFLTKCYSNGECETFDSTDRVIEECLKESKEEIKPFTAGWLKDFLKDIDDELELSLQPIEIDGVTYELSDLSFDVDKDEELVKLSVSVVIPEKKEETEDEEEIKFSDESEEVELVSLGTDEEAGEIYDFSDFEEEEPVILD